MRSLDRRISRLEIQSNTDNASLCAVVVIGDEDVEVAKQKFRAEHDGAEAIAVIRVRGISVKR